MSMEEQQKFNEPDFRGLANKEQQEAVTLVRDVYGGTRQLRRKRDVYLPRFPMEDQKGYDARSSKAVLFNALKRTVGGLVGMVFRKLMILSKDVPEEIRGDDEKGVEGHAANIDMTGRSLQVFARDTMEQAELDGHTHIFVDMTEVPPGQFRSLLEEREAGPRPYWINILKQDVLSYRTRQERGIAVLTQIAWLERTTEPTGQFGEKKVERIRVYRLQDVPAGAGGSERGERMVWSIYKKLEDQTNPTGQKWVLDRSGVTSISRIPFTTGYTNRTGFMRSEPPLEDLAHENVLHFQTRSDRMNTLHIAGVPIPVFSGLPDPTKEITVGVDHAVKLPVGGEAKYLEPEGVALEESREELRDIERRMALLGLSMLMTDTHAPETATSKRIDKSESDSQLSAAVTGIETAINDALGFHALWLGLTDEQGRGKGGSVTVNRDFERQEISPQLLAVLADMVPSRISLDTLWDLMIAGELLPETFDKELERTKLETLDDLARFVRDPAPGSAGDPKPGEPNPEPEEKTEEAA